MNVQNRQFSLPPHIADKWQGQDPDSLHLPAQLPDSKERLPGSKESLRLPHPVCTGPLHRGCEQHVHVVLGF